MIRHFLLVLVVLHPALMQNDFDCDIYFFDVQPFFDWQYSYLFSKLKEALISNHTILNLLRHGFMSTEVVQIDFSVQLQVVNGTDLPNCDNFTDVLFCPSNSSDYMWEICSENGYDNSLRMTYVTQALSQSNLNTSFKTWSYG